MPSDPSSPSGLACSFSGNVPTLPDSFRPPASRSPPALRGLVPTPPVQLRLPDLRPFPAVDQLAISNASPTPTLSARFCGCASGSAPNRSGLWPSGRFPRLSLCPLPRVSRTVTDQPRFPRTPSGPLPVTRVPSGTCAASAKSVTFRWAPTEPVRFHQLSSGCFRHPPDHSAPLPKWKLRLEKEKGSDDSDNDTVLSGTSTSAVTLQIRIHFGTTELYELSNIFALDGIEKKSPRGGYLRSYELNGKEGMDSMLAEFEEDPVAAQGTGSANDPQIV
ncbi:hypothetical protein B0H11DRAFT_2384780 [Mycena galericulata]|nr:hypothetical protein B0H11DRAFT_2384780 [Mycena galericulata]